MGESEAFVKHDSEKFSISDAFLEEYTWITQLEHINHCRKGSVIEGDTDPVSILPELSDTKILAALKEQGLAVQQLLGVVAILGYGAKKYSSKNWQLCEQPERYLDATFRHLVHHLAGDLFDPESGFRHLDHALTNLLFLKWMEQK